MTTPPTSKQPDGREIRANVVQLEIREASVGAATRTVTGYAAIFNSETDICGMWIEKIAPGAFSASLATRDVLALYAHDTARVVGRASVGTLRVAEDSKGLKVEIDLPDTTDGRDLAVLIERGDVGGMSFGFNTRKQTWDETVEPPRRTIEEVDLYEVTITANPQYDDTEIKLRSQQILEHVREERGQHNRVGALSRISARRARQAHVERRI